MFLQRYAHPVFLPILLLGFSSGLPLSLVLSTLSAWLTEEQISLQSIGLLTSVSLPYTLKFLWSPLVDALPLPGLTRWLGRRRSWLLATQLLLVASIAALAFASPRENLLLVAWLGLLVAFASASQDIVVDAYRTERLSSEQLAAGSVVTTFGYRIGMLASGAGALVLAEFYGWRQAYLAMAGLAAMGVVTTLLIREPVAPIQAPEASQTPWLSRALVAPFKDLLSRPGWLAIFAFIFFYKLGDALAGVMTTPFLLKLGFAKFEIAQVVKTYGLFALLLGSVLGQQAVERLGMMPTLWLCGILQMLSNLLFIWQAQAGVDLAVLMVTISGENLATGMGGTAFVVYISRLCNLNFTGTQYALLSALAGAARSMLGYGAGAAAAHLGWSGFFLLSTVAAIPGLICLALLRKRVF